MRNHSFKYQHLTFQLPIACFRCFTQPFAPMALGRGVVPVLLVAVLASLSGSAQGLSDFNSPAWPIANIGLNQNSNDGTQISTIDSSSPLKLDAGCSCEKVTHCSCQLQVNSNLMGQHVEFNPQVHVEFFDKNVSLRVYVKNQDDVLLSKDIKGQDFIPPLCVPVPQYPAIQICIEVQELTSSLSEKSVGLCLVAGVRTLGISLPPNIPRPTLPLGCFSATLGKELTFMPPVIPGFANSRPLIADKISVPLNPALIWPFGKTASFGEQNKNNDPSTNLVPTV